MEQKASGHKKENLLIVGAGQYGQVARETAEAMGCFDRIAFLDDKHPCAVGKISGLRNFTEQYQTAVVAIGNARLRLTLTEQLRSAGYRIGTLISPMAYISPSAVLQEGCIAEAMCVVNTEAQIGQCCFLSAGAVVNHNAVIGEGCHIDCHATVKSNAAVPAETKVEYGQVIA